jgi:pyridoxal 5'-phosphate synthase pdxT subunit
VVKRVGVLALQGDVAEHAAALRRARAEPVRVRCAADLEGLDAIVLPGGESTTIGQLAAEFGLGAPLRAFLASGRPVWGTCAGLILLARDVGQAQPLVGGLDAIVRRNHFGRQVQSFEADIAVAGIPGGAFRAVFIRSPAIMEVGAAVTVLARLDTGEIVAARQGRVLATAFHPELTDDLRIHDLFLGMIPSGPSA